MIISHPCLGRIAYFLACFVLAFSGFAWLVWVSHQALGDEVPRLNFNKDVRPILAENCFYCHGQDSHQRQAGLRLDTRDAALEFGALSPADPASSLLVQRILETDPDTQMPPPRSNRQLTEAQKTILQQWIAEGAEYDAHWAFVTPTRPSLPLINNTQWPHNAIDHFVLAKLEANNLQPSPQADRATLIKRLYADLIGLPPTPEQVSAFINNPDPAAYENLVDQLMQSQHYGERMSLPWLDAARYADSNGFQQDGDTWQWMWRDWVVQAINENLPFDQFTIWQIAGDLMPEATLEQKIASGFNRNHLLNGEGGAIAEEQRFVILFDRIDTTATTFLGLTMSCAQCHDHKYDPITQRDYYSLMDAFNRVPESGTPQYFSSRIRVANPFIEVPSQEVIEKRAEFDRKIADLEKSTNPLIDAAFHGWRAGLLLDSKSVEGKGLPEAVSKLFAKEDKDRTEEDKKTIDSELRKHFDQKIRDALGDKIPGIAELVSLRNQRSTYLNDQMPRPMIMSDAQPRDTHILTRGEYLKPGEKVTFATPAFLPPMNNQWPRNRLGLALWLVSAEQPLTARVQVNRMWQHFFGVGILKTAEDFGVQSEYPVHLDLLNWLAVEFRESGWDMKRLNRLIVTSSTYRQSSRLSETLKAIDPENRLYARAARTRMPAMILRDWALAACGQLDEHLGGKPVYPYQPDAIWESLAITKERDFTYPTSSGRDLYRRSLYTFWRRTVGPANMFDSSSRQTCKVRLSQTSTPLHALTMLNDPTWVEAARVLAEKSMQTQLGLSKQLQLIFRRILCREAKEGELQSLTRTWEKQYAIFSRDAQAASEFVRIGAAPRDEQLDTAKLAALTAVCLAVYNLDEAMTRE